MLVQVAFELIAYIVSFFISFLPSLS